MSPKRPQALAQPRRAANRNSKPYAKVQDTSDAPASTKRKRMTVKYLLNHENDTSEEELPLRLALGVSAAPKSIDRPTLEEEPGSTNDLTGEPKDHPGMPTHQQFLKIIDDYLDSLHERKKDKALITQEMHEMIYDTLINPDSTRLGTPQFRFWARKMFRFVDIGGEMIITHEGRPVAVKEHIYDILCMCHQESQHAGRDKTCKVIREYYTWIPKELTANFVKACPTCTAGRSGMVRMQSGSLAAGRGNQTTMLREGYDLDSPSFSPATPSAGFFPTGSPNDAMYQARPWVAECSNAGAGNTVPSNGTKLELADVHHGLTAQDPTSGGHRSITSPHLYLPTSGYCEDLSHGTGMTADFTKLPRLVRPDVNDLSGGSTIIIPLPPLMQFLSNSTGGFSYPQHHLQTQDLNPAQSQSLPHAHASLPPLMKYLQDPGATAKPTSHSMTLPPIQNSFGSCVNLNPNATTDNPPEIPIDPILLSSVNESSSGVPNTIGAAKPASLLRAPFPTADTILSSLQFSLLPPTPLKLQNAPSTLPIFSELDADAAFGTIPSAAQVIAGVGLGGVGLGLGRTWNHGTSEWGGGSHVDMAHGGNTAYGSFSGASWSSGSSEAGTPLSATFPHEVQSVGIVGTGEDRYYSHSGDGRYGYGYGNQSEQAEYSSFGLTVVKEGKGKGRAQKSLKVD